MGEKSSQNEPRREQAGIGAARRRAAQNSAVSETSVPSINEFGKSVIRSRLVDTEQLKQQAAEFQQQSTAKERTSRHFAKYLVESGILTRYQAERLLAGRSEGFFLGSCKVLDRLGAGGMGKVYLAEQVKLGRQVALKVLPAQFAQDRDYLARFRREARAAAGLKHLNIVQVYDVGEDRGTHFIVMELVRGPNLSERLKNAGPMSVEESIDVIRQVAAGLGHAHEHSIVHRDIKPANLVLEGAVVKILDLGLARKFDSGETITQEMRSMGTPDYMSPEQFQDAHSADIRSDLYSLGCTWYTLLSGRPPFPGGDAVAKAMAHLHKQAEPIQKLAPNVPDGIVAIIDRLMAKQPDHRFPAPRDLLAALHDWQSHTVEETVVLPSSSETPADAEGVTSTPAPDAVADSQTLIHAPSTGVPTFLLYLVPVMAALILGGAYFGIEALRKQARDPEIVVVPVAAPSQRQPAAIPSGNAQPQERASETSPSNNMQSAASKSTTGTGSANPETPPQSSGEPANSLPESSPDPPTRVAKADPASPTPVARPPQSPARDPQTWSVTQGAGSDSSLAGVWDRLVSGDQIHIATIEPLEVPPRAQVDKALVIAAKTSSRPILVMQLPPAPQSGQGLWKIQGGSLSLHGVDVYVDLTGRNVSDPEIVLFELDRADLHLIDTTITVLRGRAEGRSPVTAVKLAGERPWDPSARGNAPHPVQLEIRNGMIRGTEKAAVVDSRQASIRIENSIIAGPGTLLHLFHTQPLEYAHHALEIELAHCLLDMNGPIITIDTRPFDLHPVKADLRVRGSVMCSGVLAATDMPPQVLWQSPVADEVVTTSLKWFGQDNCYINRADCFKAKTDSGPIVTLAQTPDDWARQNLGQAIDWFAPPNKNLKLPREAWDRRLPKDYPHPSLLARLRTAAGGSQERLGADPKDIAVPRVYRNP